MSAAPAVAEPQRPRRGRGGWERAQRSRIYEFSFGGLLCRGFYLPRPARQNASKAKPSAAARGSSRVREARTHLFGEGHAQYRAEAESPQRGCKVITLPEDPPARGFSKCERIKPCSHICLRWLKLFRTRLQTIRAPSRQQPRRWPSPARPLSP